MSTFPAATSNAPTLFRQEPASAAVPPLQRLSSIGRKNRLENIIRHVALIAFLFAIAWSAHFTQSRNIGFYSDDHTFAVRPLSWSQADFSLWLRTQAVSYPEPQGRPLGFFLGIVLPYFANRLAGIDGMFIVGWWILSINAVLFYYLMRRCFCAPIPFLAAVSFLLFPADTTRPFLCHLHILQPSLTFMLIAAHLYLGGNLPRRIAAYIMIAPCLIIYETALLPFLAIPLLESIFDRKWLRRFAIHIATIFCIVAFIGLTRQVGGEYRTVQASGSKIAVIFDIFAGSIIGPAVALAACVWRVITTCIHLWHFPADLLILLAAIAVFIAAMRLSGGLASTDCRDVRRAALFGAGAILVSYLLSFTHFPPVCFEGQNTSVHLAAAIGGSSLMAAASGAFLLRKQSRQWKVIATAIIAVYFGFLFVSAQAEQDGYVTLWQERQQFWSQLLQICPDLSDRTIILCDGVLPQPSKVMLATSWSDSAVLSQVYQFPATFTQNPEVICFPADSTGQGWRAYISRNKLGRPIWNKFVTGIKDGAELVEGNTILLHMNPDGKINRIMGMVAVDGKPFHLKTPGRQRCEKYPTLPFYHILLGENR